MGNFDELRLLRERLTGLNVQAPDEYYVSPDGNENDGKTYKTAFKTFTKMIDVLNNRSFPAENSTIRGAIVHVAPGNYIEKAGLVLETDFNVFQAMNGLPGKIHLIGSGDDGELTPATDDLLNIIGRRNILSGITFYINGTSYTSLKFTDQVGGGGKAGNNLIYRCYFTPFNIDSCEYCIEIIGGSKNIFNKCYFKGPTTAAIRILQQFETPLDTIINECDFIGTNRGVLIDCDNYNTLIRKCWFSAGSFPNENMDNAIEITANMTAGKITAYENYFEQSAVNDILDNKVGGTLIEMNNHNGA